ncbi:hypothetical protein C8A05DRAFT_17849 [Staphylotrichum tortipilum]|uniref:Glutamate carboxypeptidase n=1 Tax=Staphylotrichum tortipilum TaxID=2831512 RepID=A0AAN6MF71_9PEZI|nr:hypothetical protein C8A05DRAFT_17849 [Staphylotrichum longicolle]
MAPTQDQRYEHVPPIPSYDEAVAGGSAWHRDESAHRHTTDAEAEGQSLLTNSRHAFESPSPSPGPHPPRGRRPRGYRPPTVETDDETDLFSSDDDADSDADEREADHVRREMQEMEIDDSDARGGARGSSWGKRIGLSLTLPRWKWRWRLPTLRRRTQDDGGRGGGGGAGGDNSAAAGTEGEQPAEPFLVRPPSLPKFGSAALFLLVGRTLAAVLVIGFLYLLFASDLFTGVARRMGSQMFDPESVRMHVQGSVDARRIRDHLKHFTSYPHLAGTEGDFTLMEDTELLFAKYGLEDVTRDEYQVYLNYPRAGGRAVEILGADGKPVWSAKLEEEEAGGRAAGHQTYVFHPHSKSGDVSGPLVFANRAEPADLKELKDKGIETKGAIALLRYLGPLGFVGEMVSSAEQAGFSGCLIYAEPQYANPEFMPQDGVQRDSASQRHYVIGDVLTPGWGSKDKMPRMKLDQTKGLPKIPSLPLSRRDAQGLLQHLHGFGERVPKSWEGEVPDVGEWWTGNASSPVVRLRNEQDEVEKQPIWNVYGRINGIEQGEKKVIIGNHRDSLAFGATGPHSGTAVMLEMIRVLGDLVARGWRPLRTIEFASWDGGEYNLIGSTEYVEQNEDALRKDALAYINLDAAVTGNSFHAAGSPVFYRLLLQVLNRVSDPHYNVTLRDRWDQRHGAIDPIGVESDHAAFQSMVGTSSLDLRFHSTRHPSHSSYDNFEWMDKTGDPGFVYHTLLGQVLGLLILELADRPVLPFDMPAYSDSLARWVTDLEGWAASAALPGKSPSMEGLKKAAADAGNSIANFFKWEEKWENLVLAAGGWEPSSLGSKRCEFNARMATFESDLLDPLGIPDRKQFKHVVFGPPPPGQIPRVRDGYFPSIRDAVVSGNETRAQMAVDKVAAVLQAAAEKLETGKH